jgi:hypothetical protein
MNPIMDLIFEVIAAVFWGGFQRYTTPQGRSASAKSSGIASFVISLILGVSGLSLFIGEILTREAKDINGFFTFSLIMLTCFGPIPALLGIMLGIIGLAQKDRKRKDRKRKIPLQC